MLTGFGKLLIVFGVPLFEDHGQPHPVKKLSLSFESFSNSPFSAAKINLRRVLNAAIQRIARVTFIWTEKTKRTISNSLKTLCPQQGQRQAVSRLV
jgi:ABC-type glucose/galactose transport system permease subunit